MATKTLYPVSTNDNGSWTAEGDTPQYNCIDDLAGAEDDDSTYIKIAGVVAGGAEHCNCGLDATEIDTISDGSTINKVTLHCIGYRKKGGSATLKGELKLSGSYSYGTVINSSSYYDQSDDFTTKPGGGSWSKSDLSSLYIGAYSQAGFNQEIHCTSVYIIVDYTPPPSEHLKPTNLKCEKQTGTVTDVSEAPIFSAQFNASYSGAVAGEIYIQVSTDDTFSTGGIVYDSDWVALTSGQEPGDGEQSENIVYGTGDSTTETLSSHPPDDVYYWRCKFRDNSSDLIESLWSDDGATNPSEFSGIVRNWALPAYAFRKKLYWNTDHGAITGNDYVQRFEIQTGTRDKVADDGAFNESIQASGGFQVQTYNNRKHVVYLAEAGSTSAQYDIKIVSQDLTTGSWGTPYTIGGSGSTSDSHYFPTLVIDGDGYIHIMYGAHGSSFKYTRSALPNESGSLAGDDGNSSGYIWINPQTGAEGSGTITSWVGTYPVGLYISQKDRVYWFSRAGNEYQDHFIYSEDNGETWTAPKIFAYDTDAAKKRFYIYGYRYDESRQRLHIAYTVTQTPGEIEKGIWYAYSDLDDTDSISATTNGFNVFYYKDGTVAGYSAGGSGDPIGFDESAAIAFYDDHLARIFVETLELDLYGEPIVFWEQKIEPGAPTEETYLVCATWNESAGWQTHYISDQINYPLRVRRSSIAVQRDKDGIIRTLMPVRANTWWHFAPTSDVDNIDVSRKSEASNYLEIDDGFTDCDSDGSYCDLAAGTGKMSFASTGTMKSATQEIFNVTVCAIVRKTSGNSSMKLYISDGATDDESKSNTVDSTTYAEFTEEWTENPFTSNGIWVADDIDDLEFGILNDGADVVRVTRVFMKVQYTMNTDHNWGATEIIELKSTDNGQTWSMVREVTRNTAIGVPIMNHAHALVNDEMNFIWCSGSDIFVMSDIRSGQMRTDLRDFRLYYAGSEIDRVVDYPNMSTTRVWFLIQETIPVDRRAGPDDYYLYYGNPNETTHPAGDPTNIYVRLYQNYETYYNGENLHNKDGWTVTNGAAEAYQSPPYHANKVAAGEFSLAGTPSVGEFAIEKDFASGGHENIFVQGFLWNENLSGNLTYIQLEEDVDSSTVMTFAAGLNGTANCAVYEIDGDWTNVTSKDIETKQMILVEMQITDEGCSAWINGDQIIQDITASSIITTPDRIRLYSHNECYFDFVRVSTKIEKPVDQTLTSGFYDANGVYDADHHDATYYAASNVRHDIDRLVVTKFEMTIEATDAASPPLKKATLSIHVSNSVPYDSTDLDRTLDNITPTTPPCDCIYCDNSGWESKTFVFDSDLSADSPDYSSSNLTSYYYLNSAGPKSVKVALWDTAGGDAPTFRISQIKIYYRLQDPMIELEDEEARGFYLDAAILGRGSDSFIMDATIHGYRPRRAKVEIDAIAPAVVLGSITLSPSYSASSTAAIAPSLIFGSVTITPAAASVDLDALPPTIVYTSLTLSPATASCDLDATAPTVILASLSLSPAAASAALTAIAPTIVLPSFSMTPAAASTALGTTAPSVVFGAVSISPATAECDISAQPPTVIYGSVSVTPTTSVTAIMAFPGSVGYSSVALSPSLATCKIGAVTPNVVLGSLALAPSLSYAQVTASINTILYGSVSITPSQASVAIDAIEGNILGGSVAFTPAVASAALTVQGPTIHWGSVSLSPGAGQSALTAITGAIVSGSVSVSPTYASAALSASTGAIISGSVSVTPAYAAADVGTQAPLILYGSVNISPVQASTDIDAIFGTFVAGSVTVVPSRAESDITALIGYVAVPGIQVSPERAVLTAIGIAPSLIYSSVSVGPNAAIVEVDGIGPVIVYSSVTVSITPAEADLTAQQPEVQLSSFVVTPAESITVLTSIIGGVLEGGVVYTPNNATIIVTAQRGTVMPLAMPENRTVDVGAEDRMVLVAAEDRSDAVADDDRSTIVRDN